MFDLVNFPTTDDAIQVLAGVWPDESKHHLRLNPRTGEITTFNLNECDGAYVVCSRKAFISNSTRHGNLTGN